MKVLESQFPVNANDIADNKASLVVFASPQVPETNSINIRQFFVWEQQLYFHQSDEIPPKCTVWNNAAKAWTELKDVLSQYRGFLLKTFLTPNYGSSLEPE